MLIATVGNIFRSNLNELGNRTNDLVLVSVYPAIDFIYTAHLRSGCEPGVSVYDLRPVCRRVPPGFEDHVVGPVDILARREIDLVGRDAQLWIDARDEVHVDRVVKRAGPFRIDVRPSSPAL